MFTSKFFHFCLFFMLCAGLALLYQFQLNKLDELSNTQLHYYQESIAEIETWPQEGYDIYQKVKAIHPLRFFQFIDNIEKSHNYTTGNLTPNTSNYFHRLFNDNLGAYTQIDNGRIQVKLDLNVLTQTIISDFKNIALIIIGCYLFTTVLAQLCFSRFNHYLSQLPELIEQITSKKPVLVSHASMPKQFQGVEQAIKKAQKSYKDKINRITIENQQLNKDMRQDQLTGLYTRVVYFKKLDEASKSETKIEGSIIVLRASELGYINQIQGRNAGDAYLVKIANLMTRMTRMTKSVANASHYRISSAEFAILLPELSFQHAKALLPKLKSLLDEYQKVSRTSSIAHFGLIPYRAGNAASNVINMSEMTISIAQTLGANCFYAIESPSDDEKSGEGHWRETLNHILKNESMAFYHQPIQACGSHKAFYQEFLTRFYNKQNQVLPTSTVITMAERYDLITELDKLVITKAIRLLILKPQLRSSIGINISATSALNRSFQAWLLHQLKQHSAIASKLILETNEIGMQANVVAASNFVKLVHKSSARVCFEHFGTGFTAFKFLKEVRPDFIKLDCSFTKEIHADEDNRFIVRMLVDIAKRLDVPVIATSIENQAEKIEFEQLLVDGLQGFYISSPKILKAA